jgi:serine/threonine-protein kinase HipA
MKIIAAKVSYNKELCGYLARSSDGSGKRFYLFKYADDYIHKKSSRAISVSLPIQNEVFYSEHLFGFFDNLLSEGWLRKEQARVLDINESDSFSLLLNNGADLPGAVTVIRDDKLFDLFKPYFKYA